MKRILIFIVFAFLCNISFAQFTQQQTLGAARTLVTSRGGLQADSALILPVFSDTTSANRSQFIKYYAGNMIRVGDSIYMRNESSTRWIAIGAGGGSGGSGTVTSISQGYGITNTPNPITTTGTIKVDSATLSAKYLRVADTTNMLVKYLRKADTTAMLSPYAKKINTGIDSVLAQNQILTATRRIYLNKNFFNIRDSSTSTSPTWLSISPNSPSINIGKSNRATFTIFNISELSSNLYTSFFPLGKSQENKGIIIGLSDDDVSVTLGDALNNSITSNIDHRGKDYWGTYNGQSWLPRITSYDSIAVFDGDTLKKAPKPTVGGSGTVTSVASGYGITSSPSPITTSGTIVVDTATLSNKYLRIVDTSNRWVNNITRTLGKDSIIFYKDGTRYAIKDSVGTNPAPVGYYGAFQDNTSQTAASINTAYAVKLNTTDLTNGVSVVNDGSSNPTRVTLANTGIYNIQFSLQLEKTGGSGNMIADIWIRKNGVDIPSTTGKVVLTGSANASPVIAAWNYVLDLAAGDYIQLMWATSNTNVEIVAAVATSPHPAIPSAILTVTQQSGIMAGTGITAINGLTGAAQTLSVDSTNSTFKITSTGTSHTFTIPNASTSGVTRGLLSNTQYTTFNSKIGASDTSTMLTPYLRKADTTAMLSKYLRIVDTSSLQRKSIGAYSFQANKTNATANTTSNTFRDTSGAYTGSITWTGTAPSGTQNFSYKWTQIGKMVTLNVTLVYGTNGAAVTQVNMTLPSDCPTPLAPTGVTGNSRLLYNGSGSLSGGLFPAVAGRAAMINNSTSTGYDLVVASSSGVYNTASITIQYYTN